MDLSIPFVSDSALITLHQFTYPCRVQIMGYASAWAVLPDAVQHKVNAYPFGILSRWCPQHIILAHEVHKRIADFTSIEAD